MLDNPGRHVLLTCLGSIFVGHPLPEQRVLPPPSRHKGCIVSTSQQLNPFTYQVLGLFSTFLAKKDVLHFVSPYKRIPLKHLWFWINMGSDSGITCQMSTVCVWLKSDRFIIL